MKQLKNLIYIIFSLFFIAFTDTEIILFKKYFTDTEIKQFNNLSQNLLKIKYNYYNKLGDSIDSDTKIEIEKIYRKEIDKSRSEINYFEDKIQKIKVAEYEKFQNWLDSYLKLVNNPETKEIDKKKLSDKHKKIVLNYERKSNELTELSELIYNNTWKLFGCDKIEGKLVDGKLVFKVEPKKKKLIINNKKNNNFNFLKQIKIPKKVIYTQIPLAFILQFCLMIGISIIFSLILLIFKKKKIIFEKVIKIIIKNTLIILSIYYLFIILFILLVDDYYGVMKILSKNLLIPKLLILTPYFIQIILLFIQSNKYFYKPSNND